MFATRTRRIWRSTASISYAILYAILLAAIASTTTLAQSYPTKPIRMIIPFPPGGGNDVVGRMVAAQLSQRLGKQIVIDNRGGGAGRAIMSAGNVGKLHLGTITSGRRSSI